MKGKKESEKEGEGKEGGRTGGSGKKREGGKKGGQEKDGRMTSMSFRPPKKVPNWVGNVLWPMALQICPGRAWAQTYSLLLSLLPFQTSSTIISSATRRSPTPSNRLGPWEKEMGTEQ